MEDVERLSDGKWSASTLGAYERGFRKLTVDRLKSLADFYGVSLSLILGSLPRPDKPVNVNRVVLDIRRLETAGAELAPLLRMVRSIQTGRRDYDSTFVAVRRSDIQSAALMFGESEEQLLARLKARRILVDLDRSSIETEALETESHPDDHPTETERSRTRGDTP